MKTSKKLTAFTWIEVMMAVVLIGVAVFSLLTANIAVTKANEAGADLSTS